MIPKLTTAAATAAGAPDADAEAEAAKERRKHSLTEFHCAWPEATFRSDRFDKKWC